MSRIFNPEKNSEKRVCQWYTSSLKRSVLRDHGIIAAREEKFGSRLNWRKFFLAGRKRRNEEWNEYLDSKSGEKRFIFVIQIQTPFTFSKKWSKLKGREDI